MFDTRVIPIGAAGTGAKAWTLPGGFQIAGIKIDNKSGSWMVLPDGTFVPPYTISWGHSFQPMLASIDVLFAAGPASNVSTQQGDNPVVQIYSEPVGESPGIPSGGGTAFTTQFTPVATFHGAANVRLSVGATTTVVAAIANRRFRLLTWTLSKTFILGASGSIGNDYGGPVSGFISGGSAVAGDAIQLNYDEVERTHIFPFGLDFPVGSAIQVSLLSTLSDVPVSIDGSLQVI